MSFSSRISAYNRERKWRIFLEIVSPHKNTKILDVGFTENEFSETDNFIERNYSYPQNITALGIDTPVEFRKRYPEFVGGEVIERPAGVGTVKRR